MAKYTVVPVVSDYGVFEDGVLKLICNNKRNALLIKAIMEKDFRYGSGFARSNKFNLEDFMEIDKPFD